MLCWVFFLTIHLHSQYLCLIFQIFLILHYIMLFFLVYVMFSLSRIAIFLLIIHSLDYLPTTLLIQLANSLCLLELVYYPFFTAMKPSFPCNKNNFLILHSKYFLFPKFTDNSALKFLHKLTVVSSINKNWLWWASYREQRSSKLFYCKGHVREDHISP